MKKLTKRSSCKVRSQWNWTNSVAAGKWSPFFQAYRLRMGPVVMSRSNGNETDEVVELYTQYDVVTSKNKLRGRGRALSVHIETEPGKDCHILGWNLSLTGNSLA